MVNEMLGYTLADYYTRVHKDISFIAHGNQPTNASGTADNIDWLPRLHSNLVKQHSKKMYRKPSKNVVTIMGYKAHAYK